MAGLRLKGTKTKRGRCEVVVLDSDSDVEMGDGEPPSKRHNAHGARMGMGSLSMGDAWGSPQGAGARMGNGDATSHPAAVSGAQAQAQHAQQKQQQQQQQQQGLSEDERRLLDNRRLLAEAAVARQARQRQQHGASTSHHSAPQPESRGTVTTTTQTEGRRAEVTLLTYNVWFEEGVALPERMAGVGTVVESAGFPHFVVLQEVTPNMLPLWARAPWWARYRMHDARGARPPCPYFTLLLTRRDAVEVPSPACSVPFRGSEMGRDLLFVKASVYGHPLVVGTTHLESPVPGLKGAQVRAAIEQRAAQLQTSTSTLNSVSETGGRATTLLAGDFNWRINRDGALCLPPDWADCWAVLRPGEPGYTYDPATNPMLASRPKYPGRLDYVVARSVGPWEPVVMEMVGLTPLPAAFVAPGGARCALLPSDHFGLLVTLRLRQGLVAAPPRGDSSGGGGGRGAAEDEEGAMDAAMRDLDLGAYGEGGSYGGGGGRRRAAMDAAMDAAMRDLSGIEGASDEGGVSGSGGAGERGAWGASPPRRRWAEGPAYALAALAAGLVPAPPQQPRRTTGDTTASGSGLPSAQTGDGVEVTSEAWSVGGFGSEAANTLGSAASDAAGGVGARGGFGASDTPGSATSDAAGGVGARGGPGAGARDGHGAADTPALAAAGPPPAPATATAETTPSSSSTTAAAAASDSGPPPPRQQQQRSSTATTAITTAATAEQQQQQYAEPTILHSSSFDFEQRVYSSVDASPHVTRSPTATVSPPGSAREEGTSRAATATVRALTAVVTTLPGPHARAGNSAVVSATAALSGGVASVMLHPAAHPAITQPAARAPGSWMFGSGGDGGGGAP